MGKYLLLIVGVLVVYWIIRASVRRRGARDTHGDSARQNKTIADDMVRCAECGVHLPRGESLTVRGQFYCSADHQQRHDPGS